MQRSAFWRVKTVRSGLQTIAPWIALRTEGFRLFERGLAFRVVRLPRFWKTVPGTFGWE